MEQQTTAAESQLQAELSSLFSAVLEAYEIW